MKIELIKYDVEIKKDENDIEISVNKDGVCYKTYLSDDEILELIELLQSVPITPNKPNNMKIYQLPKEFATKWVAALRSAPTETKTMGRLMDIKDGQVCYCANGMGYFANGFEVLATSIVIDGIPTDAFNSDLPIPNNLFEEIVRLNDTEEKSFPEIADWIEANVDFI